MPEPGSIFDILGPIMTGPSSSHTAGAVRIGKMARYLADAELKKVEITFYGSLAETYKGHMTDAGLVGGLLGMSVDSPDIKNALAKAREKGVELIIHLNKSSDKNPNTIELNLISEEGQIFIEGVTIGGGEILISRINDNPIAIRGKEPLLILFVEGRKISDVQIDVAKLGIDVDTKNAKESGDLLIFPMMRSPNKSDLNTMASIRGVRKVKFIPMLYDYGPVRGAPIFLSISEMLSKAEKHQGGLVGLVEDYEMNRSVLTKSAIREKLKKIWIVMKESAHKGLTGKNPVVGGLVPGDDAKRLFENCKRGTTVGGNILPLAIAYALAAMEINASMGRVCAAPTAGSCGVLPGVLCAVEEKREISEEVIVDALLVAGIYGAIIASLAPVSGALGGCQSEVGVASAMAAAALVITVGGQPEQTAQAMAIALKNILGLVCDPVAGPVEVPCIKRNAIGVANAFAAADMALAGIKSVIPPDEVIYALRNVQTLLPPELRDTTLGGLGATETALRLKEEWLKKCSSLE